MLRATVLRATVLRATVVPPNKGTIVKKLIVFVKRLSLCEVKCVNVNNVLWDLKLCPL